MCEYCEKGHLFAMDEETDSRGQRTIIGISVAGDRICAEKHRISATGRNISYAMLCDGRIRHCPMCGQELKKKER